MANVLSQGRRQQVAAQERNCGGEIWGRSRINVGRDDCGRLLRGQAETLSVPGRLAISANGDSSSETFAWEAKPISAHSSTSRASPDRIKCGRSPEAVPTTTDV